MRLDFRVKFYARKNRTRHDDSGGYLGVLAALQTSARSIRWLGER